MDELARFRIERRSGVKDGIEITKKSSRDYIIEVEDGIDLEKDDDIREVFAEKFNLAYRDMDLEKSNAIDPSNRLNRVEIKRLGEAIRKGEDRHTYKIPKDSGR